MKIVEEPVLTYNKNISVISAELVSKYKIRIVFDDGKESIVDFEPFLSASQHPSIRKYLNEIKFSQFKVINGNLNWNDYDLIFPLSDLKNGIIS